MNKMRKNGPFNNQTQLSQLQIDKLDELHVDWPVAKMDRKSWNENFEQLKAFKTKYGHTRVPQGGDWKPLCDWLCKNKRRKNEPFWGLPKLSADQISKLDELGIDWTKTTVRKNRSWEKRYEELKAFKQKYGHVRVPRAGGVWKPLHLWLYKNKMRMNGPFNNAPQLTTEQIERLDEVDSDWKS